MERFIEFARMVYKAVGRTATVVVVTLGTMLTIVLVATQHYAVAILFGLATGLLVTLLVTRR